MQLSSKAISVCPFSNVDISTFQTVFTADEAAVEKKLKKLLNRYVTWSEGDAASVGDVAVCSMESKLEKFNKENLSVTIGSHLFDRVVEDALIGKKSGDSFEAEKDGEVIRVRVKNVRNKRVPELTDEMVASAGIEGVETIEQYRRNLIEAQMDEMYEDASYDLTKQVIDRVLDESELLITQDDWQKYVNYELHKIRTYAKDEEKDIETMSESDWEGLVPVHSYFECIALLQNNAWEHLTMTLLGMDLAKTTGFQVTQEMYDHYLKNMVAGWGGAEELYREGVPFEYFEMFSYAGHYYRELDRYLRKNYYKE